MTVHDIHSKDPFYAKDNFKSPTFIKSDHWITGGKSGGNCWSGTPDHYLEAESEQDLNDLDIVLIYLAPNLTFLQYKSITKRIKYHLMSCYEYYGNYTDYAYKYLDLEDLYKSLKEMGLYED